MKPNLSATPRFLSIQSHVVSGYCGNKSATFPLQLLEFEVDVVNSVQLSNHTQYSVTRGQIFDGKDLDEIAQGLIGNKIVQLYDHILSGYVADVGYIESMARLIRNIKQERAGKGLDCCYTFDPVLGDDGVGFYVPNSSNIIEAYKEDLIPLADIITPNRFEASALSGVEIEMNCRSKEKAIQQAMKAIEVFHEKGVQIVIITSFEFNYNDDEGRKFLTCIASYSPSEQRKPLCANKPARAYMVKIPKLDCPFTGTGDMFAALVTGWLRKTNFDIKKSLENTVSTIHDILIDTFAHLKTIDGKLDVQSFELRLVQNSSRILEPSNRFKAEEFSKF